MKKMLALLLMTAGALAFADDATSSTTATSSGGSNLYVGAGAGAAWNNVNSPATSFRADAGYNFTDNWALEVGTTGVTQSGGAGDQSMQYYDLSVKGTLPLGDVFALFAQVGGAYGSPGGIGGNVSFSNFNAGQLQAGWSFMSAAGIQMNVTRQVSFNLTDYYYYSAPNPQGNTDVVLAGIKYNF